MLSWRRSAGAHAIVAARAAVQVDQHRRRAVDVAFLDEKLDHLRPKGCLRIASDIDLALAPDPFVQLNDFLRTEVGGAMNSSKIGVGMTRIST